MVTLAFWDTGSNSNWTEQYLITPRTNTNKVSPWIGKHKFLKETVTLGYFGIYAHFVLISSACREATGAQVGSLTASQPGSGEASQISIGWEDIP